MAWTYEQSTGRMYGASGSLLATGYSGRDEAKNQPGLDFLKMRGPIPRGEWLIVGPPYNSQARGPYCLKLEPKLGTQTHGRSAFLIHGDSVKRPGHASHGCIILPRKAREAIWASGDRDLLVVPVVAQAKVA